jgi:predicted ribosomally synthesized peptide with nif11-like leader
MSLDQARAFIEKMKSDEAFRNRIAAIEGVDARLAAARDAGFQVTEAEIKEVQSEVSDDELDAAAGGSGLHCRWLGEGGFLAITFFSLLKESTPSVNPVRGARFCQVTFALPEWS